MSKPIESDFLIHLKSPEFYCLIIHNELALTYGWISWCMWSPGCAHEAEWVRSAPPPDLIMHAARQALRN